jgi:D-glycero-alpha-D-manno-heptose-7-phosphate kinase
MMKKSLSARIAPGAIDEMYQVGLSAGATGGKLLGAGGGGFLLFYVEPERRARLVSALSKLLHVPVGFDRSGTQIIFYDPDEMSGRLAPTPAP